MIDTKKASGTLLDKVFTISGDNVTVYTLKEIMAEMGLNPTMAGFEILARDLSTIANRQPAWTKKYIHSVYHDNYKPSEELTRAIVALAQTIDGEPVGVAGAVWLRVLAQPGIQEGVLIPRGAVVVKCANPGCKVKFIKTNPLQRYHDPECREQATAAKKAYKDDKKSQS
jgi:hypothetical protein